MLGFGMGRNSLGNEDAVRYNHSSLLGNENVFRYNDSSTRTSNVSTHSPVPYLFGGLAAMLALIAVALLILACSFWKLSGHFDQERNGGHGHDGDDAVGVSIECAEKKQNNGVRKEEDSEKKVMVIMAGDKRPTFLAKPAMPASEHHAHNVV